MRTTLTVVKKGQRIRGGWQLYYTAILLYYSWMYITPTVVKEGRRILTERQLYYDTTKLL